MLQVPGYSSLRQNLLQLSPRYKFDIDADGYSFPTICIIRESLKASSVLELIDTAFLSLVSRLACLPEETREELEDPNSRWGLSIKL